MRQLRFLKLWLLFGWGFIGLVVYLSLTPSPPEIAQFTGGDKLSHFCVYACLMFWFGLIYLPGTRYRNIGICLILMGFILELIQGRTGYRTMDFFDMLANALGVVTGWLLTRTRLASALLHIEEKIQRFYQ